MNLTWLNTLRYSTWLGRLGIVASSNALVLCSLSSSLMAAELKIGVSFSIPPYVIQDNDSGLELELLKSALAVKGHTAAIQYLPLARTFRELAEGKLDAIINTQLGLTEGVFYSDVVISFQNCAISLEKNQFKIDTIADLQDKDIVAFQRASVFLGEEFGQMAKKNTEYKEQAKQLLQVYMLIKERTDVVVMDKNIFSYYLKQAYLDKKITKQELQQQQATCHKIFPPTEYRFAFINATIRDDFNAGLTQIRENGTLAALQDKYDRLMSLKLEADVSTTLDE